MYRKFRGWLREFRLRIRDRIELHKRLPSTAEKLGILYWERANGQYCYGVTARIIRAWHTASSIELVIAAADKSWEAFYEACRHCPKGYPMRTEMLDLLLKRAWTIHETRKALELIGDQRSRSLPFEINEPDEPWK